MKKAKRHVLNTPKAQLSLAITKLQNLAWLNRSYPKYFSPYRSSPELMKIYKLFIDRPSVWENNIKYDLNPEEKLHLIFGTDFRHIYTYEVTEDFTLSFGEFKFKEDILDSELINMARQFKQGDIVLIRKDTRDEDLKVDIQVLSEGLFQDSTEDWKVFTIDTVDLKHIRKYLKLVDSDGMNECF